MLVFKRGHTVFFLKLSAEITCVVKTGKVAGVGYGMHTAVYKLGGIGGFQPVDIFSG